MAADFDRLNREAHDSKIVCDNTKMNLRITGTELFRRKNEETYKANNGQYPRNGFFK